MALVTIFLAPVRAASAFANLCAIFSHSKETKQHAGSLIEISRQQYSLLRNTNPLPSLMCFTFVARGEGD
jgi:hypothetical protein